MMELPPPAPPTPRERLWVLLRRLALGLAALGAVFGLVAAVMLARLDFEAAERAFFTRLERETGLKVSFAARREARFPNPGITYVGLSLSRAGAPALLKAENAALHFDLTDLIDGSVDGPVVTLRHVTTTLDPALIRAPLRSPRALTEALQHIYALFERPEAPNRLTLVVEEARVLLRSETTSGEAVALGPMAGSLRYSQGRGRVEARLVQAGSGPPGPAAPLNQQPLKLALSLPTRSALAGGRSHPASFEAALGDSRIIFSGEARAEPEVTLNGRVDSTLAESFERLVEWQKSPREGRSEVSRLEANLSMDARGIGFDDLKLSMGGRALTGIAALRETGGRWSLSATLGGDLIDGTAAHRALQGIRDEKGQWSKAPLNLTPLPRIDLDLRLSSKAFRLGRFSLTKVALSVLTRPNRTEMAIVDSRFGEGSFKARVNVAEAGSGGQTLRLSVMGENIEGGELLDQAFGFDHLTGNGSFVIQAQGQGHSVAALMGSLNGTAAMDIKNGVVNGIDLTRLMNRAAEQRPETALLFSLVGKTPFEALRADFALRDGKMEPVGSHFTTKQVNALLEGSSDIGAQQHHMTILLRKRGDNGEPQGEFFGFRMEGPLLSPSIKPDNSILQNRG